jgi:hypothetical protein
MTPAKNKNAFLLDLSSSKNLFRAKFHPGRPRLWPISQIVASIAFGIGQHVQESWAGFPDDPAPLVEAPHRISASFVFPQDLGHELVFGQLDVTRLYVLGSDIGPEPQGLVHSEFHYRSCRQGRTAFRSMKN